MFSRSLRYAVIRFGLEGAVYTTYTLPVSAQHLKFQPRKRSVHSTPAGPRAPTQMPPYGGANGRFWVLASEDGPSTGCCSAHPRPGRNMRGSNAPRVGTMVLGTMVLSCPGKGWGRRVTRLSRYQPFSRALLLYGRSHFADALTGKMLCAYMCGIPPCCCRETKRVPPLRLIQASEAPPVEGRRTLQHS